MPQLFTLPEDGDTTGHAKPAKSGFVNVVDDYRWTLQDKEARKNVPYIQLIEWQIDASQLQAAAAFWAKNIGEGIQSAGGGPADANPYDGLYKATKTGFRYKFPYFEDYNVAIANSWGSENIFAKNVGDVLTTLPTMASLTKRQRVGTTMGALGNIFSAAGKAAGVAFSPQGTLNHPTPKTWGGEAYASYSLTFDLANTVDYADVNKNWELCYLLGYQSLHWRKNLVLQYPPCIYEVFIPGIRTSPAAYISGYTVQNLGNKHYDPQTRRIYPEVYRITIAIEELIGESRNIYKFIGNGGFTGQTGNDSGGQRITAITSDSARNRVSQGLDAASNATVDGFIDNTGDAFSSLIND